MRKVGCPVCRRRINRTEINHHLQHVHARCDVCGKYVLRADLEDHRRSAHERCPVCDDYFDGAREHWLSHHVAGEVEMDGRTYVACVPCGELVEPRDLEAHVRKAHRRRGAALDKAARSSISRPLQGGGFSPR